MTNHPNPQARLTAGTIHGTHQDGVTCFRGIPYALPPIGQRRFAPPQPANWQGTLDATARAPIPPQLPSRLRTVMGDCPATQDEDCLTLTVWTPTPDDQRRPVLIWLHGGAWQSGGGDLDWYDGSQLARDGNLVVVAVNYRLGALGWLAVDGHTNWALQDQALACQWVAEHIAAFGGDPGQITIMGQSAGGFNAALLSQLGFQAQRLILQSAPLGRGCRPLNDAEAIGQAFLKACGAGNLDALRQRPVAELLAAQQHPEVATALAALPPSSPVFCPVADGRVLPVDINARFDELASQQDCLVGYTTHEMLAFPNMQPGPTSERLGETLFGAPSRQWAGAAAAAGRDAWIYQFEFASNPDLGACHCIELPFTFGTFGAFAQAPMLEGATAEVLATLGNEWRGSLIRFVHGQSPGWNTAPALRAFA